MSIRQDKERSIWRVARRVAPGLDTLTRYDRSWLRSDLTAGLSVAGVALPVGVAYSELVDVPAIVGVYSAVFPLLAYALFGSSRQLITGPESATCIMVAAALGPLAGGDPERYIALMALLTLFTGVLLVLAGIARLGFIANFLSKPILVGFLNGIALYTVAGQLSKLLGYTSEVGGFFPRLLEFTQTVDESHVPTLVLGVIALAVLLLLRRTLPLLPGALIVVVAGIVAVMALSLQDRGVAVIGELSAGLPAFRFPAMSHGEFGMLLVDAASIALIAFASGLIKAESFARRNGYEIRPNQELYAIGACNLAAGLVQGFPVAGTGSRTAVNDAMGGRTQLVGVVAAVAMLAIVVLLAAPLTFVPETVLAAVIIVACIGLFDFATLRDLYKTSNRELAISITTTLGVLILGVIPGVMLAVGLSLLWLIAVGSDPHDAVLGRVPGMRGFHEVDLYPEAETTPGLLLYRFDANLVFYNVDIFRNRIRALIAASETPVEWVVVDESSINVMDATSVEKFDEFREELAGQGIFLAITYPKPNLGRFFKQAWNQEREQAEQEYTFPTLNSAVKAFHQRAEKRAAPHSEDTEESGSGTVR